MNIAIIGGGWVGCHLAMKLKDDHDITIFEKNKELFKESSYKNQNRLHCGYHYARNSKTRNLCQETFDVFLSDYGFLTKEVNKNIYCVPETKSIVDYGTYMEIFKNYDYNNTEHNFKNIVGCIDTKERYINFYEAIKFFNKELEKYVIRTNVTKHKLKKLKDKYDLVINCTNNHIHDDNYKNSFYELTISLIYKKIKDVDFGALTLVDGEFFSIYPYMDNILYTVTDVTHTPIKKFNTIQSLKKFENSINNEFVNKKKTLIETKILSYYPEFLENFKYY